MPDGSPPPDAYRAFLEAKIVMAKPLGFEIAEGELSPWLKPHARKAVQWMLGGGRRAVFASFGLAKTSMQLEACWRALQFLWAEEAEASGVGLAPSTVGSAADGPPPPRSGGGKARGLIVMPLGVKQEFFRDAGPACLNIPVTFVQSTFECFAPGLYLTNYESFRDGKIDLSGFDVVSLDEAACLRGMGGTKTFRTAANELTHVRFKFVATATPSPNEYIEILAYAEVLGVMDIGQAKTRFFKRNSEKADQLTLHPHKEKEFWLWVASWALFIQKPSDVCDCPCHNASTSSASGSEASSCTSGDPANSATAHGCAPATAVGPRSPDQAICGEGSSSAAAVCDPSTATKEAGSIGSGKACTTDAGGLTTRTGSTTAGEESRSASDGPTSPPSSPTWVSRPPGPPSNGSKTTEGTSPETVAGPLAWNKRATAGHGAGCSACRCNEGYDLPPLQVSWHEIPNAPAWNEDGGESGRQLEMFRTPKISVVTQAREKRGSMLARVARLAQLVAAEPEEHFILWHDLNDERDLIAEAVPEAFVLDGSQEDATKEARILGFADGYFPYLAAKPVMAGAGCNFQRHCSRAIFAGIGFKFHDFIQAVHRIYRFGQAHAVRVHIIYSEAERGVRSELERRWAQHNHMVAKMAEIVRDYGLSAAAMADQLRRSLGVERVVAHSDHFPYEAHGDAGFRAAPPDERGGRWWIANNDCVDEVRRMADNSVDLIVTSIPFSTQYEYSPNYADFGHTDDNDHFWQGMDFLIPQLLRVLKPGRDACIHVKDRIVPGSLTGLGFQTLQPFGDECRAAFRKHGFAYLGTITNVTDVVRENNQTYRLGWSEQLKDGTRMGCGVPEQIILLRKPPSDLSNGYADAPVVKHRQAYVDAATGAYAPYDRQAEQEGRIRPLEGTGYSRSRWQQDASAFRRSSGDRLLAPEAWLSFDNMDAAFQLWRDFDLDGVYDFEQHVLIGERFDALGKLPAIFQLLPTHSWHANVWTDVAQMRSLNSDALRKGQEKHLCPLPFDIVNRLIVQRSMPGELVFDPFAGIGTVPYCALKLGRRGAGVELSPDYFVSAAKNCGLAEQEARPVPTLFDALGAGAFDAPEEVAA